MVLPNVTSTSPPPPRTQHISDGELEDTELLRTRRPRHKRNASSASQLSQTSRTSQDSHATSPSAATRSTAGAHHHHAAHHKHHVHAHHGRHVVKPALIGRSSSHGKNLHKLTTKTQQDNMPSASSNPQRPANPRSHSSSIAAALTSPTSLSPRPTHAVKRNSSAFVVPRTSSHSALKKNHSSGHLPRHGSKSNVRTSARPTAPPMRRTQSSKSVTSQKSLKSPKSPKSPRSPSTQAHPTVRFDLGGEAAPGDEAEPGDDDDNEWTEDSASVSPNTTRDHTRQNSVILDSSHLHGPHGASSLSRPAVHSSDLEPPTPSTDSAPTAIRRNASSHSMLTPDAITSRLLMRNPSHNAIPAVSTTATATGTPSAVSNLSNSQSTLNEGTGTTPQGSGGSSGRDLVSRFLAGGNSHGASADTRRALLDAEMSRRTSHQSNDTATDTHSSPRQTSKPLDAHRRNKSTPNVASAANSKPSGPRKPPTNLPPSRTQQKLALQRASTTIAPPRRAPPAAFPRPSAPLIISSGLHGLHGFGGAAYAGSAAGYMSSGGGAGGFGDDKGDVPVHIQSLFDQIGKEYGVVRRFRRPVEDAIARLEKRAGIVPLVAASPTKTRHTASAAAASASSSRPSTPSGRAAGKSDSSTTPVSATPAPPTGATSRKPAPDLRPQKLRTDASRGAGGPEITSPEHLNQRRSRVSFELPGRHLAGDEEDDEDEDEEDEDDGRGAGDARARYAGEREKARRRNEAVEICRRMWEVGAEGEV